MMADVVAINQALIERLQLAIPKEIRPLKAFLLWRSEAAQTGKPLKVPYFANGKRRSGAQGGADDLAQLVDFDTAIKALTKEYSGLGFASLKGSPVVALDFDNCISEGVIKPEIKRLIDDIGSYTEISPSGNGVRILAYGEMHSQKYIPGDGTNIECFAGSGYVTLTGSNILGDTLEWIKPATQGVLNALLGNQGAATHTRADQLGKVRDNDPIYQALLTRRAVLKEYTDGKVGIECPFSAEHTSGDGLTSAVYFLPNTNGYSRGHFDCKHAHCAARSDSDFLQALGLKDAVVTFKPGAMAIPADQFLSEWAAPSYLVKGVLRQRFLYGLTGHSNAGKTAIALMLAASVATGRAFGKHKVKQSKVLYFAGENAEDVRDRVIALCQHMNLDPKVLGEKLLIVQYRFPLATYAQDVQQEINAMGELGLIIVDTRAAYAGADDENDNVQALADAMVLRQFMESSGAAVVVLNHPTHSAGQDSLKPRGGSAYLNELDGNLTVWNDGDGAIQLSYNKVRGPAFEPVTLTLTPHKLTNYAQSDGDEIWSIVATVVGAEDEAALEREIVNDEDRLMLAMMHSPISTLREWSLACGWPNSTARPTRILKRLAVDKLVSFERRRWKLTQKGRNELAKKSLHSTPKNGPK